MMKHILSVVLLLSTAAAVADTSIDATIVITEGRSIRTAHKVMQLADDQDRIMYEENGLRVEIIVTRLENGAELKGAVYAIGENGTEELISEPTVIAEYGKSARVTIGQTKDGVERSLDFEVVITKD